ncbi:MAG: hypothetical protein HQ513_02560 [Rhodospirillales bacterium]|nr:hypothetical protein [Rhodospirillales bacterium]
MLYEFYQHLTTSCPGPIKEVGYLRELIGMAARYRRCQTAWQPHLKQCREWIIQAMAGYGGRVVVLGSGLLYDVPLRELSDHFDDVVLVDILHMPAVRKAAKPFVNVTLETRDITGFVGPLYSHVKQGAPLALPDGPDIPLDRADLVISLNILSQLAVLPSEFAALDPAMLKALMQGHVDALEQSNAGVCLITEVEQRLCLGSQVVEREEPLTGVVIPETLTARRASWDWNFAPHPERHPRYDLVYRVEGYLR